MRSEASALRALTATIAVILCGCQEQVGSPSPVTAYDSAGVTVLDFVVDTTIPAGLGLAREPRVTIGATDSDTFQLFRVVDAELMLDGTLVVANAGNSELMFFDDSGTLVRKQGRSGTGPGEFQSISWIDRRSPDSLAVGDDRLRRVIVLDRTGVPIRTVSIAGTAADASSSSVYAPQVRSMLADGSLLIASYSSLMPQAGPQRTTATLFRYDPTSGALSDLGSWPAAELHLIPSEGRLAVLLPLLARDFIIEASPTVVAAGTTDRPEISLLAPTGDVSVILRWTGAHRQLTPEQLTREMQSRLEAFPDGPLREQRIREAEQISAHETVPAFGSIRIADDGAIWIGGYPLRQDSTVLWLRVDLATREVARLAVPGAAQVLDATNDRIVLLIRDDLDREVIAVHDLIRFNDR